MACQAMRELAQAEALRNRDLLANVLDDPRNPRMCVPSDTAEESRLWITPNSRYASVRPEAEARLGHGEFVRQIGDRTVPSYDEDTRAKRPVTNPSRRPDVAAEIDGAYWAAWKQGQRHW